MTPFSKKMGKPKYGEWLNTILSETVPIMGAFLFSEDIYLKRRLVEENDPGK